MFPNFDAASSRHGGVSNPSVVPGVSEEFDRALDWDNVGFRIAFRGGVYPLLVVGCVLLTLACCAAVGAPIASVSGGGMFWSVLAWLAIGFPFLVFACFLCSTLIAVPLVSVVEWFVGHTRLRPSVGLVRVIGMGLVATAWLVMAYCAVGWSQSFWS